MRYAQNGNINHVSHDANTLTCWYFFCFGEVKAGDKPIHDCNTKQHYVGNANCKTHIRCTLLSFTYTQPKKVYVYPPCHVIFFVVSCTLCIFRLPSSMGLFPSRNYLHCLHKEKGHFHLPLGLHSRERRAIGMS